MPIGVLLGGLSTWWLLRTRKVRNHYRPGSRGSRFVWLFRGIGSPSGLVLIALCTAFVKRLVRLQSALQRVLDACRPSVYCWLLRPLLRLCSQGVHKAHASLPPADALVGAHGKQGGINDGLIDTISQRGLDASAMGRQQPTLRGMGGQSRSATHMPSLRHNELARAFSHEELDDSPQRLWRGKWHVLHIPGSDHCLGTWFDPLHTKTMYSTLLGILNGLG